MHRWLWACALLASCCATWATDVASVTPSTVTLAENGNGAVITLVARDSGGTILSNATVTYVLTSNGHWTYNQTSKTFDQTNAYDFETGGDRTISLTAKGPGPTATPQPFTITVTVTDINEAPTAISASNAQPIAENATGSVATCTATDVDAPGTNSYHWLLVNPGSGLNDNNHFAINPTSGALTVTTPFNFETLAADGASRRDHPANKVYARAYVRLIDGGLPPIEQEIWVEVTDTNEAPTGITASGTLTLAENATGAVGFCSGTGDPDTSGTNSYGWSLVAPASGLNDNSHFHIDPATGAISITTPFDYETLATQAASRRNGTTDKLFARAFVQLIDGGFAAVQNEVWVRIDDVNETPTGVTASGALAITENATGQVATCTGAGDPDTAGTNSYAWSLIDPANGPNDRANFSINPTTGALSVTNAFNYEVLHATAAQRNPFANGLLYARVIVRVTDGILAPVDQEIWIRIDDLNEAPAAIAVSGSPSIAENATGAATTCSGTGDPDAAGSALYHWALTTPPNGLNDNANFSIAPLTGVLTVATAFDYEALSLQAASRRNGTSTQIFARAFVSLTDGALPAITREIWIEITDRNEPPTGIAVSGALHIAENTAGVVAGCVSTGDPDVAGVNAYGWSLIDPANGPNDRGHFAIDAATGALSVGIGFDYETLHATAGQRDPFNDGLLYARVIVRLTDGTFTPIDHETWIRIDDVDEDPVLIGWNQGTTLSDPTIGLRVGDDPAFSLSDPDTVTAAFQWYDGLTATASLSNGLASDLLEASGDLLSQVSVVQQPNGDFVASWPFAGGTEAVATLHPRTGNQILDITCTTPAGGHVTGIILSEILRTITFRNANGSYANRTGAQPIVSVTFNGHGPAYERTIDLQHTNAPPVLRQAAIQSIFRGTTATLVDQTLLVVDDHADLGGTLIIDALPTAGTLTLTSAAVVVVGTRIPLIQVGATNTLICPTLGYTPSATSSLASDSFICHAEDGGVGSGQFVRTSALKRISLAIGEQDAPRFATPAVLTYQEQTGSPQPIAIGTTLTWATSQIGTFNRWRLVLSGSQSDPLASTGLDPHDRLTLGAGTIVRTGDAFFYADVLIGSVVAGSDGVGRPLAIDFTDMPGLSQWDVVLALARQLQFASGSRIMPQGGGAHDLFIGFMPRAGGAPTLTRLDLTWLGVPDAPAWQAGARVVMAKAQTVKGSLRCTDTDSGPGSPVDATAVAFRTGDTGGALSLGAATMTHDDDGWHYQVPWTWTATPGATGGTFQVIAENLVAGIASGSAETSVTIVVTGDEAAPLVFFGDAPMGLLASGTPGAWQINFDQRLRVLDADGAPLAADHLQFALAGTPPPGTAIDPATGTLQVHYTEATALPTRLFRFAVLANPIAATSTTSGILPVVLAVGATPSGSN